MKSALALSLAAAFALSAMAVPQYAAAVDRDYGSGDICVAKKRKPPPTAPSPAAPSAPWPGPPWLARRTARPAL